MKKSTSSSDEGSTQQRKISDKEAIKRLNKRISELDKENDRLLGEINQLEKDSELLRSKRELQTKKLEESGRTSGFFGFVILIVVAIFILFK